MLGPSPPAKIRHNTGAANPFPHVKTQLIQGTGHKGGSLLFLTTQLRMGMEVAANFHQIRLQVLHLLVEFREGKQAGHAHQDIPNARNC